MTLSCMLVVFMLSNAFALLLFYLHQEAVLTWLHLHYRL